MSSVMEKIWSQYNVELKKTNANVYVDYSCNDEKKYMQMRMRKMK